MKEKSCFDCSYFEFEESYDDEEETNYAKCHKDHDLEETDPNDCNDFNYWSCIVSNDEAQEEESEEEVLQCPIFIQTDYCVKEKCAWWRAYANSCCVPLIADILADSTICQNYFPGGPEDE